MQLQYVQLITDKTNPADLSSGVCAILISVAPMINVQNLLPFQKFRQKLANSDVTKKTLNRTASLVADSIVDAISFITGIVL